MEKTKDRKNWQAYFLQRVQKMNEPLEQAHRTLKECMSKLSAETLGWISAILMHAATIPSLLALMTGLSDNPPSLDIILFVWTGLFLLFCRALVLKDILNIATIGIGFIAQAVIMSLILFK